MSAQPSLTWEWKQPFCKDSENVSKEPRDNRSGLIICWKSTVEIGIGNVIFTEYLSPVRRVTFISHLIPMSPERFAYFLSIL